MMNDDFFTGSSDEFESAEHSCNTSVSDSETLADKLFQAFLNQKNFLSLVHVNAQSILAHYSELLTSFSTGIVDCILISETWLKPSIPSTSCPLPGYQLFRNDRTERGGGGVGIFLRSCIPATVVCCSPSLLGTLEYLFLEIIINHRKILLGVLYSPNDKFNYFKQLEDVLEGLVPNYEHVICMGDLNTCLLKNDNRAQTLHTLTSSVNLHIVPMTDPTHYFPNCRPSLIDLAFVSNPNFVSSHGQMTSPFSYHDLIFVTILSKWICNA
ncbi:unnamed protein product [Euphydryas editha]|uniref:Endonuclease/exonuclease/phosphatase domain-containing protein n=1 Tax=Euphydryas editha TaxID=104508 RepID=A0AAU9V6Z1_EUPED|nr:unnamed protein product [Euphydryas editha]